MDAGQKVIEPQPSAWKSPSNPWQKTPSSSSPSNAWNVSPPAMEPCSLASVMDEEYAKKLQQDEDKQFGMPVTR